MTYEQAQTEINKNVAIYSIDTTKLYNPHLLMGCFVAPIDCSPETKNSISTECFDMHKNNEQALLDYNLHLEDLYPYVKFRFKDGVTILRLDDYIRFCSLGNG